MKDTKSEKDEFVVIPPEHRRLMSEALKQARKAGLTPAGREQAKEEIKKWLWIAGACLLGAFFSFILIWDTIEHHNFYNLGRAAVCVLGVICFLCFVITIGGFVVVCDNWRELRRSDKQSGPK